MRTRPASGAYPPAGGPRRWSLRRLRHGPSRPGSPPGSRRPPPWAGRSSGWTDGRPRPSSRSPGLLATSRPCRTGSPTARPARLRATAQPLGRRSWPQLRRRASGLRSPLRAQGRARPEIGQGETRHPLPQNHKGRTGVRRTAAWPRRTGRLGRSATSLRSLRASSERQSGAMHRRAQRDAG